MPAGRRRSLKTGGVKKGSRHIDEVTRAAAVASYEAGMSYVDIRKNHDVRRRTVYIESMPRRLNAVIHAKSSKGYVYLSFNFSSLQF